MTSAAPQAALQSYYALHSRIYDATRWSFLFGREHILSLASSFCHPRRVLEIGCGTGKNLRILQKRFPVARLTGVDISADMLGIASRKAPAATLLQQPYTAPLSGDFDLILCSYALSMFNPGWDTAIRAAAHDLAPGGIIAVVDFSHSRAAWFEKWMGFNHVRMQGHLWPLLRSGFTSLCDLHRPAYAGLWHYGMFIGRRLDS